MKKRGQLTIFVIIAILVFVFIIGYFLMQQRISEDFYISSEIRPAYDMIHECIEKVSLDSLEVIGESGGYFDSPEKTNWANIAYYFYDRESLIPDVETIENEMEKYIKIMIHSCTMRTRQELTGYQINSGEIEVDVKILEDDKVYFNIDFPFSIIKNNRSFYFDRPLEFVSEARLHSILFFASEIVNWHEKEPRAFCFSCAGELGFDLGLGIDMWRSAPNEAIFYITDYDTQINDVDYMFFFIIKYPEDNNYDPFEGIFY